MSGQVRQKRPQHRQYICYFVFDFPLHELGRNAPIDCTASIHIGQPAWKTGENLNGASLYEISLNREWLSGLQQKVTWGMEAVYKPQGLLNGPSEQAIVG